MNHTALLLLPILFLGSCAGTAARNRALLPAMHAAYNVNNSPSTTWNGKGIYWDIRKGIDAIERTPVAKKELRLLADDLGDALKSQDYLRVARIDWPRLRAVANLGISERVRAGEIGEGVAASYSERLALFSRSFQLLQRIN